MEGGDEVDSSTNKIADSSSTSIKSNKNDDRTAATAEGVVVNSTNVAVLADESKKSERKRKRERQRRSDLANAFEELSTLVIQIDPDDNDILTDADGIAVPSSTISTSASIREHGMMGIGSGAVSTGSSKRGQRRKSSGEAEAAVDLDGSGMTRLDLISRTTMLLRRLRRENIELRRRVDDYKKGRTSGIGSRMGTGENIDDMVCLLLHTRSSYFMCMNSSNRFSFSFRTKRMF